MPRVNRLAISIETGESGRSEPVTFEFNGHELPFENVSGGTGPNEVFEGEFAPNSFAHSVVLVGPKEGEWNIAGFTVNYEIMGDDPYTVRFGEVTLDQETSVNIWQDPPLKAFDV